MFFEQRVFFEARLFYVRNNRLIQKFTRHGTRKNHRNRPAFAVGERTTRFRGFYVENLRDVISVDPWFRTRVSAHGLQITRINEIGRKSNKYIYKTYTAHEQCRFYYLITNGAKKQSLYFYFIIIDPIQKKKRKVLREIVSVRKCYWPELSPDIL